MRANPKFKSELFSIAPCSSKKKKLIKCVFFSSLFSPPAGLNFLDHIVGNQPDDQMVPVSDW